MTKGTAMLIAFALALMPATGAAQQIGASFTVLERPAQPELQVADASSAIVPAGWAYGVTRDADSRGVVETHVARSRRTEVALPPGSVASATGRGTVTWTFVPL